MGQAPLSEQDKKEMLKEHIPYRLRHLDGLCWACDLLNSNSKHSKLRVCFDNNFLSFKDISPLTNALVEAGIQGCRSLLGFLGIKINYKGTGLIEINEKKLQEDDFFITQLGLKPVTLEKLASAPTGQPEQIKLACKHTLFSANKAVAHLTNSDSRAKCEDASLCAKTVMWLIEEYVYKAKIPHYRIWTQAGSNTPNISR